jgi:hypothetical protein
MNLWVAVLILVIADGIAIAVMLAIRRRAPSGSFFQDTAQATGVFAVAGTTFAVLMAFTFFLSFQSYDGARNSAENEANAVHILAHTANFFPAAVRDPLQGDLVCYGRAVVHFEWPAMREGERSPVVDTWGNRLQQTFERVHDGGAATGAAIQNWFTETDARQVARRDRLSQAKGVVPAPVWLYLIIGALLVVVFVFFFADSRERRLSQSMLVIVVATFAVAGLVMVRFFETPYANESGSIRPTAMNNILAEISSEATTHHGRPPCNGVGRPA